MNSINLYASHIASPGSVCVTARTRKGPLGTHPIFVRAELMKKCDSLAALNKAKPREGEVFLNSVDVTLP